MRPATIDEEWAEVLALLREEAGHDLEREHHDAGHPGQSWMADRAVEYLDAHGLGVAELEARLARRGLRFPDNRFAETQPATHPDAT